MVYIMLPKSSKNNQPNLFYSQLRDMLDTNDPLISLADTIKWDYFDKEFAKYYSKEGRPAKPIRYGRTINTKICRKPK